LGWYKTVFLDLDNTLYSFDHMYEKSSYYAIEEIIGTQNLGVDFTSFYKTFRKIADTLYFEYEEGKRTIEEYQHLRWKHTFEHFKVSFTEKQNTWLNEYILAHALDFVHPFPGSLDFLIKLKNTHKVGLITNGPIDMQMAKLIKMDLLDYFDEELIIISEQVQVSKPHPFIFQTALKRARVVPKEALHIGDSVKHDIIGANKAGIDSGLIHGLVKQQDVAPTYVFKDFFEASKVLLD
jgi:putative hydrolase of the HAD superfamily